MSALKSVLGTIVGVGVAVGGLAGILLATGVLENQAKDPGAADGAESKASPRTRTKSQAKARELASLGYIGAVEIREQDRKKINVTKHLKDRVRPALSLYNPCAWGKKYRKASGGKLLREARLINREGKVLREWKSDFPSSSERGWAIAKLSADGYLYAVNARAGLVKLDWDNNKVWGLEGRFHHDFAFAPDGKLWVLTEERGELTHDGVTLPYYDNGVAVISPEGELEREFRFFEKLAEHPLGKQALDALVKRRKRLRGKKREAVADLIHSNTADFVTVEVAGRLAQGDFITAFRELDTVAVIDHETGDIKWVWGVGELDKPHDPSQLPSGNLLIFDNGMRRKWSRVLEIDPREDGAIRWEYKGSDEDPFFSSMRGLAQLLEDEHILVTDSQTGRVIEIQRDGEILWEFWSPYVLKSGKLRVPIRMIQLEGEALTFAQNKLDSLG